MLDPRNTAPEIFIATMKDRGLTERHARRVLGAVLGKGITSPAAWALAGLIPKISLAEFSELKVLRQDTLQTSAVDGFQKILFRTEDDLALETVIIPLQKENCVTICLSSQVGCVMGCAFCATARMERRRNLETWEIIDQFQQAKVLVENSGRRITGAVFMGMGEPFLNYERVIAAAKLLCFPVQGAISGDAITVSTVGLVPEIEKFTDANLPFRLSISLGAATDEKRARLVPVASRTPVKKVIAAARRHALARNDRVNLAYVCISGENVSEYDAEKLGELIGDTPVRIDLIEVTDATGRFLPPTAEEMSIFRDALTKYVKQPIARRYSGGADIAAACGTLAGK